MPRYYVRCRRCEVRRVLKRHPDHYQRLPPCRSCGHKSYRVVPIPKQVTCNCTGYWFPHKKGNGCCDHAPRGFENQARRSKVTDPETLLDIALECPGKLHTGDCPF